MRNTDHEMSYQKINNFTTYIHKLKGKLVNKLKGSP